MEISAWIRGSGIALALLFVSSATMFGANAPIPYSDTGLNLPVDTLGPDNWMTGVSGKDSLGNTLPNEAGSNWNGSVNGVDTWLYCIDDQRDVNVPQNFNADVTPLSQISSTNVDLGTAPGNSWTNQIAGANTATARYEMAAYLASNFITGPGGYISTAPSAGYTTDQEIQSAIWALTNNSLDGTSGISLITNGVTGPGAGLTANSFWIAQAEANYSSWAAANGNNWAVISFLPLNAGTGGVQTLLVQLTPEPAFYSVLMLGLGGLFLARRRRRV